MSKMLPNHCFSQNKTLDFLIKHFLVGLKAPHGCMRWSSTSSHSTKIKAEKIKNLTCLGKKSYIKECIYKSMKVCIYKIRWYYGRLLLRGHIFYVGGDKQGTR